MINGKVNGGYSSWGCETDNIGLACDKKHVLEKDI